MKIFLFISLKEDLITPTKQSGNLGKYIKKRTPKDGELNPNKSIASQFNFLRVSDLKRLLAFINLKIINSLFIHRIKSYA